MPEKILSFDDLERAGLVKGRATLARLVKAGLFPAPIRLSERRIGWRSSDVEQWLATRPEDSGRGAEKSHRQVEPASAGAVR